MLYQVLSSNSEVLVNLEEIAYAKEGSEHLIIKYMHGGDIAVLGRYDTKERALELIGALCESYTGSNMKVKGFAIEMVNDVVGSSLNVVRRVYKLPLK